MSNDTARSTSSVTRRTALAGFAGGGLGLAAMSRGVSAQDAASETAMHPIVGAWGWNNNPDTPDAGTSFAIFHGDGTYIEFDPSIGVGVGAWRATGERTVDLIITFQDNDLDANTFAPGLGTFWMTVDVDAAGNGITAAGELQALDSGGEVLVHLPYSGLGTRMVAEAPAWFGTPMATPTA